VSIRPIATASVVTFLLGASGATAVAAEMPSEHNRCDVSTWQVTWGVKESFRAYLSGSIANGEWTTSGNVSYNTPSFTITGSEGWISRDGATGQLVTDGEIRFMGHGGILDQTLSDPAVSIAEESIALVFDVSGDTQEGVSVDEAAVPFVSGDSELSIDSANGEWSATDVATALTEEGASAFGTYPAGEPFDPVTIRANLEPGCLEQPSALSGALGWVAGIAVVASAAALAVTSWVRKSRGRGRLTLPES
jgi:hypothetical protein